MQEEIDRRKLESRTVMNPKKEQLVKKPIKVGIAIGGGTGLQLTKIFEDCLKKMAQKADVDITFEKSAAPYYSSYEDIKKFENTKDQSIKEAESLHDQYTKWFGSYDAPAIDTVFRTSVNAEALYLFRQKVGAIKEILIPTDNGNRILLIRDQTEGFYSNTSYEITDKEITFSGKYSKKHLQKVIALTSARATRVFEGSDYLKWYIAKHHLFGYTLEEWCKEIDRSFDLIQPDTGLTQTFEYLKKKNEKNLLILTSNEVGDLMYEPFMESLQSSAPKLDLYSRSDFLNPPFNGKLVEYQTVHGSADDIAGKNLVLPYSTMRIASVIAEKKIGIERARSKMDKITARARLHFLNKEIETNKIIAYIYKEMKGLDLID